MKLKKVVFPVAGLGSRFLPATKSIPKEMLPIADKPLIQYAVEEAIDAGFTDLIFITSKTKGAIKEHFDISLDVSISNLSAQKKKLLDEMNQIIPSGISCTYITQEEPLGLGHAILQAKIAVGHDPFAVVLADDLIEAKKGVLKQMVEKYEDISSSIIAVQKINMSASIHYGMISTDDNKDNMRQLNGIVEKPLPKNSPSDLAVVGRYIFANKIFEFLENTSFGAGNEIQLTDGIKSMLSLSPVYAFQFEGMRFDCGNKLDFYKASIEFSLKNPILGKELEKYLKSLLS